jgi:glycosyltransferase involved in cell wall biosynthesis
MRILAIGSLYPPYHLGGYELVWQAGVRALRSAGHEVRVLTTGEHLGKAPGEPEDPDVHRELRWYWHDHEFPRLSVRARLELERHNSLTLRRHIQELRPELVSWWAMGGMSLSLIEQARRAGLPAVGWVNDEWLGYGPRVDQWMHLWRVAGPMASSPRRLAQAAWRVSGSPPIDVDFERAATWVFCSEITRRSALRSRPDLTRTQVLYQGVDPVFRAIDPPERWRGRLLYAGRLDERKGLGTLIEAVAHQPELSLRIVGDGDQRTARELRDQAHAEGARVSFDPGVDRAALARVYGEADAVVFPVEWSEPWGLVPLEAMAVGRPVVATGRGGSGEYLEHEGNALLFQAGDALALRAAVGRLAADRGLREQLRLGGFETAARFSETAWLDAVVRVHEEAAAP